MVNKVSSLEHHTEMMDGHSGEWRVRHFSTMSCKAVVVGKTYVHLFDEVLFGGGGNFLIVYGYRAQAFSRRYSSMLYLDCWKWIEVDKMSRQSKIQINRMDIVNFRLSLHLEHHWFQCSRVFSVHDNCGPKYSPALFLRFDISRSRWLVPNQLMLLSLSESTKQWERKKNYCVVKST